MARKIKFPLIMENGAKVRDLQELKDNFSIISIYTYLKDGRLITWLNDRDLNDLANKVKLLDIENINFSKNVCKIFGITYSEKYDIKKAKKREKKIKERNKRITILKNYTDDSKFIEFIDNIAFNQEELYNLINKDQLVKVNSF